jgi:two-component system CheB/CheR fusion protein
MNEELRSVNDLLESRNRALHERSTELADTRRYFAAVLDSMGVAVIVVDRGLVVTSWGGGAEELWGIRTDEAEGVVLLALDIGLPVEELAGPIRSTLGGTGQRTTVAAHNRRGQTITCSIVSSPLAIEDGVVSGAVLLIEQVD